MGVKAENRFKRLTRRYYDELLDSPAVREREHVNNLEDEIRMLRAQLRETQTTLARAQNCVQRQRVYLSAAYEQVLEARAESQRRHGETMKWFRAFQAKNRAWLKLSQMVRDLVSPDDVCRWREDHQDEERG